MNSPIFKTNARCRCRCFGALVGLVCGLLILAGCRTETKQKWLTFLFDGVPQPGATNALTTVTTAQPPTTNTVGQTPAPVVPARPPTIIHPPYAKRDCTACHESQFSQKMLGKPGEVCFGCHVDLKKSFAASKVKHQPVGDGDCMECHTPHAGKIKGLLKKPVKETCLSCHDDLIGKKKFVHQPVGDGDCLACHNPHAANIKGLLKQTVKATCADCHDDIPNKKSKSIHQPVADGDCLACHNPHATDKKALVKKTAPALCWDCHDNFLEKARFKHDVVEDCTACHKPHQSAETGLLAKNILKLCGDCHDDKDLKAVKGHAGTEGKSCTGCHDPHVGKDKFLLKASAANQAVGKEAVAPK